MVISSCAIGLRGPALNVDYQSATLSGDVASNRDDTGAWWFEYGTTTSYDVVTNFRTVVFQANVPQHVIQPITGLEPAATYHYVLCAQDHDTTFPLCSGDQTFTTAGDYVRGSVVGASPVGFGIFTFNDVRSGPAGESPVGSITAGALTSPVTCLRVTGNTRVTVGAQSLYFFFDLPLTGAGTASAESLDGRDPAVCPLDPTVGGGTAQVGRLSDFSMHDDP